MVAFLSLTILYRRKHIALLDIDIDAPSAVEILTIILWAVATLLPSIRFGFAIDAIKTCYLIFHSLPFHSVFFFFLLAAVWFGFGAPRRLDL